MLGWMQSLLSKEADRPEVPESERVRLATCVLLMEAAKADEEFSPEERDRITAILRGRFALSDTEAAELVQASETARAERYDLWHFTHQINQACSVSEKVAIIEELWRVTFADGTLDGYEDHLVHKVAHLLNLNHPQLIEAKLRARDGAK